MACLDRCAGKAVMNHVKMLHELQGEELEAAYGRVGPVSLRLLLVDDVADPDFYNMPASQGGTVLEVRACFRRRCPQLAGHDTCVCVCAGWALN